MPYDLVTLGEIMLRLWVPAGQRLEEAPSFGAGLGGTEANTAVAAARHGLRTAWISRLPDNPLGRRAARSMAGHGVDVSHVRWEAGGKMGLYFLELSAGARPASVIYDRAGSSAAGLRPDDVPREAVEGAKVVHLTGITLGLSDSARRAALETADRARRAGAKVVVDVNYRSRLWPVERAAPAIRELCGMAEVAISTREDARDLFGAAGTARQAAAALREDLGVPAAIVTNGAEGAAWAGSYGRGERGGHQTPTLDRVGAGDAFAAGVIIGLAGDDGDDLAAGVERGLAMAAVKLGVEGDWLIAYPEEIESVLSADSRREVSR